MRAYQFTLAYTAKNYLTITYLVFCKAKLEQYCRRIVNKNDPKFAKNDPFYWPTKKAKTHKKASKYRPYGQKAIIFSFDT